MPIPTKKEIQAKKDEPTKAVPKKAATEPWKPCSTLHIPEKLKDPCYDYRWCDNTSKNIRSKTVEGWQIDDKLSKMFSPDVPTNYASSVTSATEVAGMVVMKLPKVVAKQRKEYYANKTKENTDQINRKFSENSRKDAPDGKTFGQGATER